MKPNPSNDPEYRQDWHLRRRGRGIVMLQAAVPIELRERLKKEAQAKGMTIGKYLQHLFKIAA